MKNNCKGFILLETLIVAVFIVAIFAFLYSAVIPLLGTYEDLTNKSNIDVVYKLYHVRKNLYNDTNYETILSNSSNTITIDNSSFNKLIGEEYIDLGSNYQIIYAKNIKEQAQKDNILNLAISDTLKKYINGNVLSNYIKKHETEEEISIILLYDDKTDSAAHLSLIIPE